MAYDRQREDDGNDVDGNDVDITFGNDQGVSKFKKSFKKSFKKFKDHIYFDQFINEFKKYLE